MKTVSQTTTRNGEIMTDFDIQIATDDELNNEITTLTHAWCYGAKRADLVKLYFFLKGE